MQTTYAVIVASGRGTRLVSELTNNCPKQYQMLNGRPVLAHTLEQFIRHGRVDRIQVVINEADNALYEAAVGNLPADKLLPPVYGGKTRQISVANGLSALKGGMEQDVVLVHDAARPLVTGDIIDRVLDSIGDTIGATAALPVSDTLRSGMDDGRLDGTVDRDGLWMVQTPQGFPLSDLCNAHKQAAESGHLDFTDDTALYEWADGLVTAVVGGRSNIKITYAEDLVMAEALLPKQELEIRVGTGYDVHAFDEGDAVILGGVSIPHSQKLKGHSDADVGLHALTDAILGALGDGDIGAHFPPSDPQWKGAASDQFLIDAVRRVHEAGGRISHLDLTLVCEAPKIGPHRETMRVQIAGICGVSVNRISVKATTSERLGFTGRKEGIAAIGTATLRLPNLDD